jgi:hypothetical protein
MLAPATPKTGWPLTPQRKALTSVVACTDCGPSFIRYKGSMKRRSKAIWAIATVALIVAGVLARGPIGRTRPDLVAWFSFDDGPLTFSLNYRSGSVGRFKVGDTHAATIDRLSSQHVLAQDMPQLGEKQPVWKLSLPAASGGYVTYTIMFAADRITSVRVFYSVFAGL